MFKQARIPSVPLITVDPYFSLWSPHDHLYDGNVTHWCGDEKKMTGTVSIDGCHYRFMGDSRGHNIIPQTDLTITPTSSVYTFANDSISLKVSFTTPLLLDRPELVSRPCTYVRFAVQSADGKEHAVKILLSCYENIVYDEPAVLYGSTKKTEKLDYAFMGKAKQSPLNHSGDHVAIDWGYLYLAVPAEQNGIVCFLESGSRDSRLTAKLELTASAQASEKYAIIAYDDIASINYFGDIKRAYWTKFTPTIIDAITKAAEEYDSLMAQCAECDREIYAAAEQSINQEYADLCATAYRHTICAHKLIEDNDGNLIFLSKENDSNGCIGTIDVTYPSVPLYLMHGTDYVKGMLLPIFKFAACDSWEFDFAPHDVGRYPYATGQVYGLNPGNGLPEPTHLRGNNYVFPPFYLYPENSDVYDLKYQMPVEESGNMLILTAVVCQMEQSADFAKPHFETLKKWVHYLSEYGADPGEQLCTDDFAGHLAHNANLSVKAILGIYSFSLIAGQLGESALAEEYRTKAAEMAKDWEKRAANDTATRLTFDKADSWSLKYNLLWDLYFDAGLFQKETYEKEIACYLKKNNEYGVPLDSRADYSKSDWILWTAALTDDREQRAALVHPIHRYLEDSPTRIAFGDWYNTVTAKYEHFIARSVQGGIFMPIFFDQSKK